MTKDDPWGPLPLPSIACSLHKSLPRSSFLFRLVGAASKLVYICDSVLHMGGLPAGGLRPGTGLGVSEQTLSHMLW